MATCACQGSEEAEGLRTENGNLEFILYPNQPVPHAAWMACAACPVCGEWLADGTPPGAAEERARIVAWLRASDDMLGSVDYAESIERGEHLK
jgi:hypothetical protein